MSQRGGSSIQQNDHTRDREPTLTGDADLAEASIDTTWGESNRAYQGTDRAAIRELAEAKHSARESRGYVPESDYLLQSLKSSFARLINSAIDSELTADHVVLTEVPEKKPGELSLDLPDLKHTDHKRYIQEILPKVVEALTKHQDSLGIDGIKQMGPYLNFELRHTNFTPELLSHIANLGERYGELDIHAGERILIDFGSPNLGKSLHVGHSGSTIVGQVLTNIYEASGYTTFAINHLGDWGTPMGKLKVAVEEWGDTLEENALRDDPVNALSGLYARFGREASVRVSEEEDAPLTPEAQALVDRARHEFKKLEDGNPESIKFWEGVREQSIAGIEATYSRLGISYDLFLGESFYEGLLDATIAEAQNKGIAASDDAGAVFVDLNDVGKRSFLMRKSDGASSYQARDVAALKDRKELLGVSRAIYVVGNEQRLNFEQAFETATRMGYIEPEEAIHISIGLMKMGGAKISSRDGGSMALESFIDAGLEKALEVVQAEDRPTAELEKAEQMTIAEQVGKGALYFSQLETPPHRDVEFNLDRALSLNGKTAPYIQYAAVRASSIIDKVGPPEKEISDIDWSVASEFPEEVKALVRTLSEFPEAVKRASETGSPHHIANYAYSAAKRFSSFFQEVRVKDTEGDLREAYKHLVLGTRQVLENSLHLLGIEIPSQM